MGRKKTEGTIYLNESQRQGQRTKAQIGVRLPPEIIERLRNVVWATGIDGGMTGIIENGTVAALEKLEKEYQAKNGVPVPTRPNAKIEKGDA